VDKYVEILKQNTIRKERKLSNTDSLEVRVAITKLSDPGNDKYLQMYVDWLNKGFFTRMFESIKKYLTIREKTSSIG
jgi:hypothetical protein